MLALLPSVGTVMGLGTQQMPNKAVCSGLSLAFLPKSRE